MSRRPANSGRALTRGFVLLFAVGLVAAGAGCGNETFSLLQGQTDTGGAHAGAGDALNGGGAGSSAGSGGSSAGGEISSGGRNSGGFGGLGHGGSSLHPNGGTGNVTLGFGGDTDGGNGGICLPGETCVDGGARCPPDAPYCRRCESDNDCTTADARFCDVIDGRCVECIPDRGGCSDGETCDPTLLRCAKSCTTNKDCSRYCSMRSHFCVDCQVDADCREGQGQAKYSCYLGICVECELDTDCADPSKEMCQSFECVPRQ